ncbi:NAD(P)-dependent dehydrogenase (short-subunit alcohol dehydrogenase family) [Mucilaginibacter gracilis]|uniref:NAD(P)-dependent dehydrogenase (Short-subunit alcohol dehydrogenase family) n=1 Tax=Mucilaginibacter gracilis TaxID=423350 RepID=A0A495J4N3_9SPHI|nr:SDR family oxidoreductase [Mucilaginibacter gracilis]RKR83940.1 NAD(P)-dependent dehydrogenase (short-subunit alcohol dehydrogenase family) [Mucilaginibacter gracilis]
MHSPLKQFTNHWAIILGGSSGFGLASVEKLASHGMNIAILYRETRSSERELKNKLTLLAQIHNVIIAPFNINALDASGREQFIEQTNTIIAKGSVKLLLHSIARGNLKPLMADADGGALSVADIEHTSYAMSNSLLDWARLLIKNQLFNTDARIIGLTSEGSNRHWDGYAAVSIAKASLQSLATYMAVELSKYGLRTNLIQAGVTNTPSLRMIAGSEQLIETAVNRNPMGRITEPQDVANVIYLLCTAEAAWINGSLIHVDGGEHCR